MKQHVKLMFLRHAVLVMDLMRLWNVKGRNC